MRSSFASRRKARKIGHDEDEEPRTEQRGGSPSSDLSGSNTVTTPSTSTTSSPRPKKSSRLSFTSGEPKSSEDAPTTDFVLKKSALSRKAIENAAARRSTNFASGDATFSETIDYSSSALAELRNSTPSTPAKDIDVASKFGPLATLDDASLASSAIPSATEIAAKKARRARLAHESDYISLDADDNNGDGRLALFDKPKYAETRLVRDDEDVAEGFDEFVDDGRVAVGRKAEKAQRRKAKEEMRVMIESAERRGGGSSSGSEETDESEEERERMYEAAQTAKAVGSQAVGKEPEWKRPKTPPKITAVRGLGDIREGLAETVEGMRAALRGKITMREELEKEKVAIEEREKEIQKLLEETGEKYEKLRIEAGEVNNDNKTAPSMVERGLESFGQRNGIGYDPLNGT